MPESDFLFRLAVGFFWTGLCHIQMLCVLLFFPQLKWKRFICYRYMITKFSANESLRPRFGPLWKFPSKSLHPLQNCRSFGRFLLICSYINIGTIIYLDRNRLLKALIISFKSIFGSLNRVAKLNLIKSALKLCLISTFLGQVKLSTGYTAGAT